jgi:SPP1 gp7 family putative phage head morphogenesis protein
MAHNGRAMKAEPPKKQFGKGDVPGHEFHGNQYTDGEDGGGDPKADADSASSRANGYTNAAHSASNSAFSPKYGNATTHRVAAEAHDNALNSHLDAGDTHKQLGNKDKADRHYASAAAHRKHRDEHRLLSNSHKVAKARVKLPTINRDRPATQAAAARIKGGLTTRLAAFRKKLVNSLVGKLAKKTRPNKQLADIISRKDWESLSEWLAKEMADVYMSGTEIAAAQLGVSTMLTNEDAVKWAREYAGKLVTGIEETTREGIANLTAQATADGWSNSDLADALTEAFDFSEDRADMIARTETAFADIAGNQALYRESGMVEKLRWIVADEDPCDECVGKGDADINVDAGEDELPPLHPNCRCDVVPILPEDEPEKASPARPIHVEVHTAPITINIPENRKPGPQSITFTKNESGETIARLEDTP